MPKIALITCPRYFSSKFRQGLNQFVDIIVEKQFSSREALLSFAKANEIQILCCRIETKIDCELLDLLPSLEIVASATSGLNHCDQIELKKRNITLFSDVDNCNAFGTAELALVLMLALSRNIRAAHDQLVKSQGKWDRENFIGYTLKGRRLGVIGCGVIGSTLIEMVLKAFSMQVFVFDPILSHDTIAKQFGNHVRKVDNLIELFSCVDVVSIHCPLNKHTHHMIERKHIDALLDHSNGGGPKILINASRGPVINHHHLQQYFDQFESTNDVPCSLLPDDVENKRYPRLFLGIDVYDPEPPQSDCFLFALAKKNANILLTPHIGGSSFQAIDQCCQSLLKRITDFYELQKKQRFSSKRKRQAKL